MAMPACKSGIVPTKSPAIPLVAVEGVAVGDAALEGPALSAPQAASNKITAPASADTIARGSGLLHMRCFVYVRQSMPDIFTTPLFVKAEQMLRNVRLLVRVYYHIIAPAE